MMDLVSLRRKQCEQISADYRQAVASLGFKTVTAIPICARFGDNVVKPSRRSAWYTGPSLLSHLETVEVAAAAVARPFRMPVQWVNRASAGFRGYAGTIASGTLRPGDMINVGSLGRVATVERIVGL